MADSKLTVTIVARNLKEVDKVAKEIERLEKSGVKVNAKMKVLDTGIASLGNRLGFLAFQFRFMASTAGAAFDQIMRGMEDLIRSSATTIDKMQRAVVFSGINLQGSLETTTEQSKILLEQLNQWATKYPLTLDKISDATKMMGKSTNDFNATISATPSILKMMVLDETDAATAATAATLAVGLFGDQISNIEDAMDSMMAASFASRLEQDDLNKSFSFAASSLKAMGATYEQVLGVIALSAQQIGTNAGSIGRNFRGLATDLSSFKQAGPALQQVGIALVDSANNMRPFLEVISDVRDRYKELNKQGTAFGEGFLQSMQLSTEALNTMRAMLNMTDTQLKEFFANIKSGGDVDQRFAALVRSPAAQIQFMENSIKQLQIAFVGGLSPAITETSNALQHLLKTATVQELMIDLGVTLSEVLIPALKITVKLLKPMAKFLAEHKDILKILVPLMVALVASLGALMIAGSVGAVMSILGAGLTAVATALHMSVARLALAVPLALVFAIAVLAMYRAVKEMTKPLEDMNATVYLTAGALAAATIAAGALWGAMSGGGAKGALAGAIKTAAAIGIIFSAMGATVLGGKAVEAVDDLQKKMAESEEGEVKLPWALPDIKAWEDKILELQFNLGAKMGQLGVDIQKHLIDPIKKGITDLGNQIATLLIQNITWANIQILGEAIWNNIYYGILNAIKAILNLGQLIWESTPFQMMYTIGEGIANNIWYGITEVIKAIFNVGKQIAETLGIIDWVNEGYALASKIWQGLVDFFTGKSLRDLITGGGNTSGIALPMELGASASATFLPEAEASSGTGNIDIKETEQVYVKMLTLLTDRITFQIETLNEGIKQQEMNSEHLSILTATEIVLTGILKNYSIDVAASSVLLTSFSDQIAVTAVRFARLAAEAQDLAGYFASVTIDSKGRVSARRLGFNTASLTGIGNAQSNLEGFRAFAGTRASLGQLFDIISSAIAQAQANLGITSLASGGVALRPTRAIVGDIPGGEAIIPLSKLNSVISSVNGSSQPSEINVDVDINIANVAADVDIDRIADEVSSRIVSGIRNKIVINRR